MTSPTQRLKALEHHLTPQQVVMGFLREMAACGTVETYLQRMLNPKQYARIPGIHAQLSAAAIHGVREKAEQTRARQQMQATYNGLVRLATLPAYTVEQERYRWLYEVTRLALLQLSLFRKEGHTDDVESTCAVFQRLYVRIKGELVGFEAVITTLSQRYFEGMSILVPDQTQFLSELHQRLDALRHAFEAGLACWAMYDDGMSDWHAYLPTDEAVVDRANAVTQDWLNRFHHEARIAVLEGQRKTRQAEQVELSWLRGKFGS